jgi:hypothetical protein
MEKSYTEKELSQMKTRPLERQDMVPMRLWPSHSLILKDSQLVYSQRGSKRLQLLVHSCKCHEIIFLYRQIENVSIKQNLQQIGSQGKGYIHRKCSIWQNFSFLINFCQRFPYGCNMMRVIKLRIITLNPWISHSIVLIIQIKEFGLLYSKKK